MGKTIKNRVEFEIGGQNKLSAPLGAAASSLGGLATPAGAAAAGLAVVTAGAVAMALAVHKGVEALTGLISESAATGDELQKTALRLGLEVEQLERLRFAADRSGASQASITTAIRTVSRAAIEARDGMATYKDAFDELGVSVVDRNGELKDSNTLFSETADAIGRMENKTAALGLAQQVMGRSATDLMVLFREQSSGIQALGDEADRLGGIMSTDLANDAATFTDRMTDLRFATRGVKNVFAEDLLPAASSALERLTDLVVDQQDEIESFSESLSEKVTEALDKILSFAEDHGPSILRMFERLASALATISGAFIDAASTTTEIVAKMAKLDDTSVATAEALEIMEAQSEAAENRSTSFGDALENLNARLGENAGALGELPAFYSAAADATSTVGTAAGQLGDLLLEEAAAADVATSSISEQIEAMAGLLSAETDLLETKLDHPDKDGGLEVPVRVKITPESEKAMLVTDKWIRDTGEMALKTFGTDFSRAMGQMGRGVSMTFAQAIRDGESLSKSASKLWDSFVTQTIGMLIQLIAKLTLAAILSAFLGFGNMTGAVRSIGQLSGLVSGGGVAGKRRGGFVDGPGVGDTVPTMLAPGEFVIRPEAVDALGVDFMRRVNQAGAGTPAGGDVSRADLVGGRMQVDLRIEAAHGTDAELREYVRRIVPFFEEAGALVTS